jgi:hypothetical protein
MILHKIWDLYNDFGVKAETDNKIIAMVGVAVIGVVLIPVCILIIVAQDIEQRIWHK